MTTGQLPLPLLPPTPGTPDRSRLAEHTRRLGLTHLAEARAVLDAAARARHEREAAVAARQSEAERKIGSSRRSLAPATATAA